MKKICLSFCFLVVTLSGVLAQVNLADSVLWQLSAASRAEELEVFFSIRNYKSYARFNHPKLVELMGGAESFAASIEASMKELDAVLHIDSLTFGKPFSFYKCDSSLVLHCLLPQTLIVSDTIGNRVRIESYLFGVSEDNGDTWYFIDVSSFPSILDSVVPNRCLEFIVPERRQYFMPKDTKKP